jgi:choline dehydrogenase-like flavoprotein
VFADARRVPTDTTLEADLCIIGAGPAGITLAREFIGASRRVIVLESGGFNLEPTTQALDEGRSTGLPYFDLATARLRYFGGTSNHWDGLARPFDAIDFERREAVPLSGWPIGKADLEPLYARARVAAHVPSGVWDFGRMRGRDPFSPLLPNGARLQTRFAQQVPRSFRSFGTTYREELRRARNVFAYLHANVMEIETDPAAKMAARVRVATLVGNRFFVAARAFVVACGGIENPRLLLVSNRRRPNGLGNDHDLVGRCFLEHPRFVGGTLVPSDRHLNTGFYDLHEVGETHIKGYLSLSDETKRAEGLVDVQIDFRPVYEERFQWAADSEDVASARALRNAARERSEPDELGRDLANVAGDLMTWQTFTIPGAPLPVPYPEVARELIRSQPGRRETLIPALLGDIAGHAYEQAGRARLQRVDVLTRIDPVPNKHSRVSLSRARDELGMPRVELHWRLSRLDKHSARRALEILASELGRRDRGRIRIGIEEGDASWPADLEGGWHHMGTTRMSDDPRHGVVDRDCRVHGMSNLFVAGSSVFPTAGSGTPTLTLVALSLRLADHLKGIKW